MLLMQPASRSRTARQREDAMMEMQSAGSGITLPSHAWRAEGETPGLVWLYNVSGAAPRAHVRTLMAGLSKGGFGRWQVCTPPAEQPAAVALLEGRLRSALLVLLVDAPSLAAGRLQSTFQSLALLGKQPFVVLLDGLAGHVPGTDDADAAKAHIRQLAARHELHQLDVVTVDAGRDLPAVDAGIRLGSALLQMASLRAAYMSGPLRMQVLTGGSDPDPTVYGELLEGGVAAGDFVRLLPSGQVTQVRGLAGLGGRKPRCGDQLTLRLAEPVDVRGVDLVTAADEPVESADEFEVQLVSDTPDAIAAHSDWQVCLGPSRRFHHARLVDLQPLPAGESGASGFTGRLCLDKAVPFAPSPALVPLRLFSLHAGADAPAAAAGTLLHASRTASNIHRQAVSVDKATRARHMGQRPCVIWLTGLSGAGKSTIANLVEQLLLARGLHTYLLDGDNVRHGLNRDLGFSDQARAENIRRVAEVAKLMVDAGLIVITAFISPFRSERELARRLMADGEFLEVHVDAPLALAEQRDVKGLYRKARRGEIKGFTGIDAPYEPPENPELHIDTSHGQAEDAAAAVLRLLQVRGIINPVSNVVPLVPRALSSA
jgi:bifunctional enzyme CysN/CysC